MEGWEGHRWMKGGGWREGGIEGRVEDGGIEGEGGGWREGDGGREG